MDLLKGIPSPSLITESIKENIRVPLGNWVAYLLMGIKLLQPVVVV